MENKMKAPTQAEFKDWLAGMDDAFELFTAIRRKRDFSIKSISVLEEWLLKNYDSVEKLEQEQMDLDAAARYVGEVIIKNAYAEWKVIRNKKKKLYGQFVVGFFKMGTDDYQAPINLVILAVKKRELGFMEESVESFCNSLNRLMTPEMYLQWGAAMDTELEEFIAELPNDIASKMDFSLSSLSVLQKYINQNNKTLRDLLGNKPFIGRAIRYVGEIVCRHSDAKWHHETTDKRDGLYAMAAIGTTWFTPPIWMIDRVLDDKSGTVLKDEVMEHIVHFGGDLPKDSIVG